MTKEKKPSASLPEIYMIVADLGGAKLGLTSFGAAATVRRVGELLTSHSAVSIIQGKTVMSLAELQERALGG